METRANKPAMTVFLAGVVLTTKLLIKQSRHQVSLHYPLQARMLSYELV